MTPVTPAPTLSRRISALAPPTIPYLGFTLALFALTGVLELVGAMSWIWWHKAVELPLVLYLYFLFRQLLPDNRRGAVIAALPVLIVYVVLDSYYLLFGRVFRITELREVPEMLDVLPWYQSGFIVGVVLLPFVALLWSARKPRWGRLALGAVPLVLLVGSILFRPDLFLRGFLYATGGVVEWSDEEAVYWNGRFSMMLYQEAKRRAAVREAARYKDEPEYEQTYEATLAVLSAAGVKRNIHVVVLEGFIDPGRMQRLFLKQDPVDASLRSLLVNGKGNLSVSPVFGGYTAQAEFEVLCGVPALQVLGTIEFNLFTGARVHCLPDILRSLGYQTLVTNAYKPNFFNAISAYRGTGFDEIHFAREYAPQRQTYLTTGDVTGEKYMFDQGLFDQNLAFVRQRLKEHPDQPLLNYILTIYGHYPYMINEQKRPRVVEAKGDAAKDGELMTIINQVYYRSRAMAAFIKELIELDPEGIILMITDHLPPLEEGKAAYERLRYLGNNPQSDYSTLIAVLDRGRPVAMGPMHHHDVPQALYQLLTDGTYCGEGHCKKPSESDLRSAYLRAMAHAVSDVE